MNKLLLVGIIFLFSAPGWAQTEETQAAEDPKIAEVKSLVDFYAYMLNSIGAEKTTARDKEVIITQSFNKVFANENVQIEDDLIEDRKVITNKNVSAYLRDVDFFFQSITFEFQDLQITEETKDNGETYYLATFESVVSGTTLEGEPYNTRKNRFIEVNVNEQDEDLKIVSVYTNKMSREKELRNWWSSLSFGWINIFKEQVPFDSLTNQALYKIAAIDSLNLNDNSFIVNIEPLAALRELTYVNINGTRISDITPLRYASNLKSLSINNTPVEDIASIQYFDKLISLDASGSVIRSVEGIERLKNLESLNLSNTPILDFQPIQNLTKLKALDLSQTSFSQAGVFSSMSQLTELDVSGTPVVSLTEIAKLSKLQSLDISNTPLISLEALKAHSSLKTLAIENTTIADLSALSDIKTLRKVNADYTGISEKQAAEFMSRNPSLVVISNSEKVEKWWLGLSPKWKEAIRKNISFEPETKEDLIRLANIDSLDLADAGFTNSEPLSIFTRLTFLNIRGNYFNDLSFLSNLEFLQHLNLESVPISNTSSLKSATGLQWLSLKNTQVVSIEELSSLKKLELLNLENTPVTEEQIGKLIKQSANLVVLYKEKKLVDWWSNLTPEWKKAFGLAETDSYALHKLIEQREVSVSNVKINTLSPLDEFIALERVVLNNTLVTDLSPLNNHPKMVSVTCTNGPLQSLEGITGLRNLKQLNVSNTAVEDMRTIEHLTSLESLNCSGTSIKNFKGIDELINLKSLDVSNTRVWKLSRIYGLQDLKTLTCYNTRLSSSEIEDFKVTFSECEVTFY